ncbi:MAG: pilus assembly protein [Chloroflexi bacterium]|nr:pilus assembly protein [Chloroflexota bacterium]MBU1751636.1 pilus assembly protein [Chloroflexota bacterium]
MPHHWRGQRGSTAVEALVVLIILSMLTYAALELGRAYVQRQALDAGCLRAARYLSVYPDDPAQATQLVQDEVNGLFPPVNPGDVTVHTIPADTGSLAFLDEFTVFAELPWAPLTPLPYLAVGSRTIQVQHTRSVERYP